MSTEQTTENNGTATLAAVSSNDGLGAGAEAGPPPQAFGIIDPDYARIFTQARILAWQYGYACVAHGTFTRDLDLLLVPWADRHVPDAGGVVNRIADVCGLVLQGQPSDKPHGREAWTLLLPGFTEVRWVDVSAFAPPEAPNTALESELADAAEALLRDLGFGRIVFDTTASDRLWAALSAVRGRPVRPQPQGCYPEEWGPSTDRRLTCACGNEDPAHWHKTPNVRANLPP